MSQFWISNRPRKCHFFYLLNSKKKILFSPPWRFSCQRLIISAHLSQFYQQRYTSSCQTLSWYIYTLTPSGISDKKQKNLSTMITGGLVPRPVPGWSCYLTAKKSSSAIAILECVVVHKHTAARLLMLTGSCKEKKNRFVKWVTFIGWPCSWNAACLKILPDRSCRYDPWQLRQSLNTFHGQWHDLFKLWMCGEAILDSSQFVQGWDNGEKKKTLARRSESSPGWSRGAFLS